ncbi:hypothetical protein GTQ40_12945 [Flavobacteriaceae bacterium R38]|nr:hypothetical protein [Flavobacteriaceae bacterium R38]
MENPRYSIQGMTMAITNMEKMLSFYSNVFDIQFEEKEMYNSKLYTGIWGGLNLLFCPAEIAQNTATQNRHQFDIIVSDIQKTIYLAIQHGGETIGDIFEDASSLSIGIYDPDKNSITFKQLKE